MNRVIRILAAVVMVAAGIVPVTSSAAIIDLTATGTGADPISGKGASGGGLGVIGGAFMVKQVDGLAGWPSTGTGVIKPFLRIQDGKNEHGFNADYPNQGDVPTVLDTKVGTHTHSIRLSDVNRTIVGGTAYREFFLDIDEANGDKKFLSLNQIQIFLGGTSPLTHSTLTAATNTTPPVIGFGTTLTEVFRMNNAASSFSEIVLNYDLGSGSGSGDMTLLVLDSAFQNYVNATGNLNPYLVLYSQFGKPPGGNQSEAGFEEWASRANGTYDDEDDENIPGVPEPATLAIWGLGVGIAGLVKLCRNKKLA